MNKEVEIKGCVYSDDENVDFDKFTDLFKIFLKDNGWEFYGGIGSKESECDE